jgi:hypothetical protein
LLRKCKSLNSNTNTAIKRKREEGEGKGRDGGRVGGGKRKTEEGKKTGRKGGKKRKYDTKFPMETKNTSNRQNNNAGRIIYLASSYTIEL